jgi:phage baseplate assembly protein W
MSVNKDFLGAGWSFPPTFTRLSYSVDMVRDDNDIHESLYILFSTNLGERLMVPLYGTGLNRMVFKALTTTLMSQIKTMVQQAILMYEPRIDVDLIDVTQDVKNPDLVLVSVHYTIRKTNTRSNMVYPFYLTQQSIPAMTQ